MQDFDWSSERSAKVIYISDKIDIRMEIRFITMTGHTFL